jgi:hypothetical protein
VKFTESHNNPNIGIWRLIISVLLIVINYVGKSLKNDATAEYQLRKIVESFMVMNVSDSLNDDSSNSQWDSGIPIVSISTKRNLRDYLNSSFA